MTAPSLVQALAVRLNHGEAVRTELGLFFAFETPRAAGLNPSTGALVEGFIAGRRVPLFVASEAALATLPEGSEAVSTEAALEHERRVLQRNVAREHVALAKAMALPAAVADLALGPLAEKILNDLRSKGRATVRDFGAFAPKSLGGGMTIGFTPGKDFRERVNLRDEFVSAS